MTITVTDAKQLPLITDDDILRRVSELLGSACRRQLWLLFLDATGVQLPLLIPVADYPPAPAGAAEPFADAIARLVSEVAAAEVVLVWERRLDERATRADQVWGSRLADACIERGVRVRAQLICHRSGVRMFAPAR